jgi:hypothetical protein
MEATGAFVKVKFKNKKPKVLPCLLPTAYCLLPTKNYIIEIQNYNLNTNLPAMLRQPAADAALLAGIALQAGC